MVRFIFICMGVVAVAIVTLAAQGVYDGIQSAQTSIEARNERADDIVQAVAAVEPTAEELNDIMPTAGDDIVIDQNDSFTGGFTNQAPQALADDPVLESMVPRAPTEDAAN